LEETKKKLLLVLLVESGLKSRVVLMGVCFTYYQSANAGC